MAAAMAGGEVRLTGTRSDFLGGLLEKLNEAGAEARATNDGVEIKRNGARLKGVDLTTEVYPGFATDMQAPFMALMTMAEGDSIIRETIFENRFMHAPELMRLGADISLSGGEARVHGVEQLRGAPVMATDLRASVSLVIAGWRRRARRWSTASTTSTAASSGSRRSSAAAAPRSAGLKATAAPPNEPAPAGGGRRRPSGDQRRAAGRRRQARRCPLRPHALAP
jgi:hypothetical protein